MRKIITLLVSGLIVILFVTVLVFAPAVASTGDELTRSYKPLVVQITSEFTKGSELGFGFIVGERDGYFYIITANHVVRKNDPSNLPGKVWLTFYWDPGSRVEAERLNHLHTRLDLALLRIKKSAVVGSKRFLLKSQAYCCQWQDEQKVWFIGRQSRKDPWWTPPEPGVLDGDRADLDDLIHFSSSHIQPGTSGAPLLTEQGIVGMIQRDAVSEASAVEIGTIREFVTGKRYPWNLVECGTKTPVEPVVKSESTEEPNQEIVSQQPGKPQWGDAMTEKVTKMEFVWVEGGCFQMGEIFGNGNDNEISVHEVCLDGFYMGRHEVTQGQYRQVMGSNPSEFKNGDNYPVEKVSWHDAREFIEKFKKKSGRAFRLPTEAEWEYAARSGGRKEKYSGGNDVDAVAWYYKNSENKTHPVGRKMDNGLGLYDMSGNVWEWCSDWYGENYYSSSPKNTPQGPLSGSDRVIRGGGWDGDAWGVLLANREWGAPGIRDDSLGFRLVLSPGQ